MPAHYETSEDGGVTLQAAAASLRLPTPAPCASVTASLERQLRGWQCNNETTTDLQGVTHRRYRMQRLNPTPAPTPTRPLPLNPTANPNRRYRMQRVPGTRLVMLDCQPFMMRGVSYSPVPWGHDPSYHEPFGDYFTDEFHDIIKVRARVGARAS